MMWLPNRGLNRRPAGRSQNTRGAEWLELACLSGLSHLLVMRELPSRLGTAIQFAEMP